MVNNISYHRMFIRLEVEEGLYDQVESEMRFQPVPFRFFMSMTEIHREVERDIRGYPRI